MTLVDRLASMPSPAEAFTEGLRQREMADAIERSFERHLEEGVA